MNIWYFFKIFECGHFCINYMLKKDKIKNTLDYNKQFMSLGLVCRVLKEYYNEVNCYHVDNVFKLMNKKRFITLITINKHAYHYVVVENIENNKIYYYDPAFLFIRKVRIEKFVKRWSGYCCFVKKSNC